MNKRSSDDELSQTSSPKRRRATDLPTTSSPTLRRSGRRRVPPLRTRANERRNGSLAHVIHYESSPHKQPSEVGASDTTSEDHPHRDPLRNQDDEKITVRLSLSSSSHTPASFNERSLRARAADPNEGRCLVTNTSDRAEATHVLDPGCSYLQLEVLEDVWQMANVHPDTRHNVFFLDSSLRVDFEADKWLLLPEPTTIDLLVAAYSTPNPLSIENVYGGATEFAFYMIPRDDADGSPLRRNTAVPDQPPQHITLRYPYVRLGPLRSHVFPHFAVVNAALKLEEHHDAFLENTLRILKAHFDPVVQNLDDASALFAKISQLHDIWMAGLHKHLPIHRVTHAVLAGGSDSESAMWSAQEKALKDPDVLHWVADLNQGLHESKGRQKPTPDEGEAATALRQYALEKTPTWLKRVSWPDHCPLWAYDRHQTRFAPVTRDFSSNDWSLWRADTTLWRTRAV